MSPLSPHLFRETSFQTEVEDSTGVMRKAIVYGSRDEGITAVLSLDGKRDYFAELTPLAVSNLADELFEAITDERYEAADRLYDQMRDDRLTGDRP